MASSSKSGRGYGGEGEDKMMSSLSHSLQRAWPSDKNMIRSVRNETMDSKAQETKVMSGLLRKASMLCKPGGGVDPAHKALMKDLVLSNDKNIQTALDLSSTGKSAELNRYLALLSREKLNPEKAKEVSAERRELIRQWQDQLKIYELAKDGANNNDARKSEIQRREAIEREKMRISKGLGSKRSRPGSMMRLTSFRDNHRPKVGEEANTNPAAPAKEPRPPQLQQFNPNATSNGSAINGMAQHAAADMFAQSYAQQQLPQNYMANVLNPALIPSMQQAAAGMPNAMAGAGFAPAMTMPNAAQPGGLPMLNPMQLQALQAQTMGGMQPMFGNPSLPYGAINNEKLLEALALQQKQQLAAQQAQMQQFHMQVAAQNPTLLASGAGAPTTLSAAAAAVQAQAQAQQNFRQMNPGAQSLLPGAGPMKVDVFPKNTEREKIRVQRLMLRREKKSKRERQRRLVLNTLYDELGAMLFDNNEHETKDRATILQSAIEYLNKSCNIAVPKGDGAEREEEEAMNEQCIYPNCESPAMEGKDCCFVHGGSGRKASHLTAEERLMRRRGKKSKREKQRRHNVNVLSERLGEMLNVTECKDKTTVLNVAIQYLRKHPRKKGEKVLASDAQKTPSRSPASLKTGISFLRASKQEG